MLAKSGWRIKPKAKKRMAAFKCKKREEGMGALEGQSPSKGLETEKSASILPYFKLQDTSKAGRELELPKVCRGITLVDPLLLLIALPSSAPPPHGWNGESLSPKESIIRTPSASKMLVSTLKLTVGLQWPSNQCLQVGVMDVAVQGSQTPSLRGLAEEGREGGGGKKGREEGRKEGRKEGRGEGGRREGGKRKRGKEGRKGGREGKRGRKEKREGMEEGRKRGKEGRKEGKEGGWLMDF
ncbi:hypothetical protein E2320_007192 [Naja naja]|nr:hypothetical protein E2320_007192 [Naja naja]